MILFPWHFMPKIGLINHTVWPFFIEGKKWIFALITIAHGFFNAASKWFTMCQKVEEFWPSKNVAYFRWFLEFLQSGKNYNNVKIQLSHYMTNCTKNLPTMGHRNELKSETKNGLKWTQKRSQKWTQKWTQNDPKNETKMNP